MHQFSSDFETISMAASKHEISQDDFRHYLLIQQSKDDLTKSFQSNTISASDHAIGINERHFWWERDRKAAIMTWELRSNIKFVTIPPDVIVKSQN